MNINYERAIKNHVRADAEKALKIILSGDDGEAVMLFPQALNPLLKALESIEVWKQIIVIPYNDENNKPLYIVYKIGNNKMVTDISVK